MTQALTSQKRPSFYQSAFIRALGEMKHGSLEMRLSDGTTILLGGDQPGPQASMTVHSQEFFTKSVLYGGVGFGEAYVDGDWDTTDIRAVLEWFIHNIRHTPGARGSSQRLAGIGLLKIYNRIQHLLRPNSVTTSRRNISEHYDLGNAFYKLWLDPTMTYSAAKFTSENQTLEEAQCAKYDAICQKLRLLPGDRVLEIGCGWGGFSIHAATHYGCHVTGVTISHEQHKEATERVAAAGLTEQIKIVFQDYRTIEGKYDKIASIEMLEAVGDKYVETYFRKCHDLLAPHGMLAFQVITVPDNEFEDLRKGTDWIQKHIFPGSLLLSTARINQAINRVGDLFLHSFEDLGAGYSRTLREWCETFNKRLDEVRQLGFDQRFIRKWNYYLRYCEAAFATRNISVIQACYTMPGNTKLHSVHGIS